MLNKYSQFSHIKTLALALLLYYIVQHLYILIVKMQSSSLVQYTWQSNKITFSSIRTKY